MLDTAEVAALLSLPVPGGKDELRRMVDQVESLVGPAFDRRLATELEGSENKEEERARRRFSADTFVRFKAYAKFAKQPQVAAAFDQAWGKELLDLLSKGHRGRADFSSPFPAPDPDFPLPYTESDLLDALGALSYAFRTMERGGLIGHWEISVPADDDGNVVTIAVDDDISLGAQFLLRDQGAALGESNVVFKEATVLLSASGVQAMARAALERAGISCRIDSYLIDPSTTKQSVYEPTQLLLSLSNLQAKRRL